MFLSMAQGLSVNTVVLTIMAVAVGILMIGSLLSPIAADVMVQLTGLEGGDGEVWANMVGATVVFTILGLVILAVNSYTKG